jgi:ADP-ribosyl-[dinitrogen reductase] hydrolase
MVSRALELTDGFCREMGIVPTKFFWHIIRSIQKGAAPVSPRENSLDTLAASVQAFLSSESFEEALVDVVNRGEDTDTAGCITGGLAGTYYGFDAIPQRWVTAVKNSGQIEEIIASYEAYWRQKGLLR